MASELDKELSTIRHIIYQCWGADCKKHGAKTTGKAIEEFIKSHELEEQVLVIRTKCVGQCEHAPLLCIQPDLAWYGPLEAADVPEILGVHLLKNGKPVEQGQFSLTVSQPQLTKKRKR